MSKQDIPRQYRWKVRERLAVVEYAVAHGLKPAATRFDLDRKTVRAWRARWRTQGLTAVPREDLKRLLGEGVGVTDIARRYNVNHSTVSRAVRALDHQDPGLAPGVSDTWVKSSVLPVLAAARTPGD